MEGILELIKPLVEIYLGEHGFVVQAVTIIGSLRVFIKPIMAAVETYVLYTPKTKDDEKLAKLKDSKGYKTFVFIMDWFVSIKFPKK